MAHRNVILETPLPAFGRRPAETARWHLRCSGEGPGIVLAMHGFGQSAAYFDHLAKPLHGIAEVWSLDMPAHGKTEWPPARPCHPQDLVALLETVKEQSGKPVTVLGFSMGGRYAGALAQVAPERLQALHLVAPEMLRPNRGQRLGTGTWLGRWLLRYIIEHPGAVLNPIRWLEKSGIVSRKMAEFVRANLGTQALRQQLHDTWHTMSGLPAEPSALATAANQAELSVQLWVGQRDPLVRVEDAQTLATMLSNGALTVMDRGHFVAAAPGFARGLAEGWPERSQ